MKIGKVASLKGLALIGIVAIGGLAIGCDKNSVENTELRTVALQTVGFSQAEGGEGVSGNIVPVDMAKVSFKIAGVVEEIYVKEGDLVKKGDMIAKIKPKDYALALSAAKAQYDAAQMSISKDIPSKVAQAKAQLNLTEVTYNRVKALYDSGAASKADLDQISAKLTVDKNTFQQATDASGIASTQLGQAKAAYDLAVDNLKETVVYSPIDGIILKKIGAKGEVQAAGYPVVVVGSQADVWAEFGVTDKQIGQFNVGQSWPVFIYGIDKTVEGTVSEIGALADEKTRLFTIKLKLDNEDGAMKAGMIAKSNFNKAQSSKILVPFLSVVHLSDSDIVYLYDSKTHTVQAQKIQTGDLIDDRIEVISGLKIGDQVVVEGQYQISDKEQVSLHD